jgi:predicted nucleotidyltransferase
MFSPYEKIILDRLTAAFSTVSDIMQIVVFGSRSRGGSNDSSDLDVLVLVKEINSTALQTIQSLKAKALNDVEDFCYVNVFPVKESEFYSSRSAFQRRVQKEGIIIWSRKELKESAVDVLKELQKIAPEHETKLKEINDKLIKA